MSDGRNRARRSPPASPTSETVIGVKHPLDPRGHRIVAGRQRAGADDARPLEAPKTAWSA